MITAKAALEAVCYQTRDLLEAMNGDWPSSGASNTLRVDGGMSASNWTMQNLANILDVCVERPTIQETTALGAAWLAGASAGLWPDMDGYAEAWSLDQRFDPEMDTALRTRKYDGWLDAVSRTRSKRT